MSSKFWPKKIIMDFFKFHEKEKIRIIVFPACISLIVFFININTHLIDILLVSLSIFMGFLLNLMLFSFNLRDNTTRPIEANGKLWTADDFLVEYHVTLSFEIFITIVLVILLLSFYLIHDNIPNIVPDNILFILKRMFNFTLIYLVSLFFLIIFRVLKFGYILIKYYIKNYS